MATAELYVLPGGGGNERALELLGTLANRPLPLLWLGVVTTAVAQQLQVIGQKRIAANDAAVIYALDPLYAACTSAIAVAPAASAASVALASSTASASSL